MQRISVPFTVWPVAPTGLQNAPGCTVPPDGAFVVGRGVGLRVVGLGFGLLVLVVFFGFGVADVFRLVGAVPVGVTADVAVVVGVAVTAGRPATPRAAALASCAGSSSRVKALMVTPPQHRNATSTKIAATVLAVEAFGLPPEG